jgi:anti-sigma factor RsiW
MIDRDSPVTEEELHAFVDGELPADRQEAVSAWLAAHPEQATLVGAWRAQADAIRAKFGAVAGEPVPERLKLESIARQGSATSGRRWGTIAAAAAVVAFLIGGGTGWVARGATAATPSGFDTITADALEAYKLYVVEVRHPVEVPGNERAHMTQWLTKRLGYEQRIPDLESLGLKLVGGRLLPGPTGVAAAFYMYEGASGERFTIYSAPATSPETALRYKHGDRYDAFYWVDDQHAYVVSGPADQDRLRQITRAAWEQIDRSVGRKS